jgi:hypothetical protein
MAYLDSNQIGFNKILSEYYHHNEKKLLVSNTNYNMKNFLWVIFEKILVVRRWFDDRIEIQNTNIEFDEKSLQEFQRNQNDIEENFKFFLTNHWQNAKKYTLPIIFDLDERYEVGKEKEIMFRRFFF